MNGRERGFLLLTSHLGDPDRKVLTVAQLRVLTQAVTGAEIPHGDGDVTEQDLMALGFNRSSARRIVELLSGEEQLNWYLQEGKRFGLQPITRVSTGYPLILRKRLGLDSPGCLWTKGDIALLQKPLIALVGSRDLYEPNLEFAYEAGRQAALQGYTLVSGNARGADKTAQRACLEHGGTVISVVADALKEHTAKDRVLYLSEDGFDLPFSAQRALSRNRVIHCLADVVLVAQCTYGKGGTWDGTIQNLENNRSAVFCFDDGSKAAIELTQRGAQTLKLNDLRCLADLRPQQNLFDQT